MRRRRERAHDWDGPDGHKTGPDSDRPGRSNPHDADIDRTYQDRRDGNRTGHDRHRAVDHRATDDRHERRDRNHSRPDPEDDCHDGRAGVVDEQYALGLDRICPGTAAAAVLGLVLWRRRHTKAATWSRRLDDLSRRSRLALDDVVAQGSLVTGEVQALADEARSVETSAPDSPSKATAAALRVRLDDLAAALEADRKLRLGSTPPSEDQLAYSTALVHHEIEQLQSFLRAGASSA
ncbi:MAG: hypothetical protein ACRDPZ_03580 [Gaiellaceae bacterium]